MSNIADLTNQRYGRLVVLEYAGRTNSNKPLWKCQCDCGNIHITTFASLRSGECISCGCYQKETIGKLRRTHGCSNTRLYKIWKSIRQRCYNTNDAQYFRYGGRGIKLCDEWQDFVNFKTWSENNGYSSLLTIDRINNDGNYEPSNCRWADMKTQTRNRRNTCKVEYNGNLITVKELSEQYNVNYYKLYDRIIRNKMPVLDALNNLLNC